MLSPLGERYGGISPPPSVGRIETTQKALAKFNVRRVPLSIYPDNLAPIPLREGVR